MKKVTVFVTCLTVFLLSCKKNEVPGNSSPQSLIENAKSFFNGNYGKAQQGIVQSNSIGSHQNPRISGTRIVLWDQATIFKTGNSRMVIAPVQYSNNFAIQSNFGGKGVYAINEIVKLCVYSDSSGQLHSNMLTFFPDSNYRANSSFTGVTFVDDWLGNPITKYKFEKGGPILKWNGDSPPIQESSIQTESTQTETVGITETCLTITGYNYVADDPSDTYEWSESGGCIYTADQESFVAGVGRAGISSGAIGAIGAINAYTTNLEVVIPVANNVIANIVDYDRCFTQLGTGNIYQVIVCVSQPNPGTRQPWGLSETGSSGSSVGTNPVNVGHVFLVFNEISGPNTIKRNVGFYPQALVTPPYPSSNGVLNDDDQDGYNISLSVGITSEQFFNMLNYLAQNSGDSYNLNTLNCATFALKTLYAGDVILPSTIGQWFDGSGNDPGDLGEDIRAMNLTSNMTRNTVSSSHPNLGTCN